MATQGAKSNQNKPQNSKSSSSASNQEKSYPVISLFSGAMGLDIGLMQAGLEVKVSQDFEKWCIETIRKNNHVGIEGDIRKLLESDPTCKFLLTPANLNPEDVFAVVGGPPCQSFSTAGKRKGVNDSRGELYKQFIQVIETIRPRFFIMENVKGLASMPSDPINKTSSPLIDVILNKFKEIGYSTVHGVLDAVHYGTPQFRERLVIIGSRDNESIFLPIPTHFQFHQNEYYKWKTLGSAISNLSGAVGDCAKFSPNIVKYLAKIPEGSNWKSLSPADQKAAMGGAFESGGGKSGFFRRLSSKEPSPTLLTSPIQKATLLCHPLETRPLSVREYARIQQFPDEWLFQGKAEDCYRQIGNAVPVPLGKALGEMLLSVARGNSEIRTKRMRGTSVHSKLTTKKEEHINAEKSRKNSNKRPRSGVEGI